MAKVYFGTARDLEHMQEITKHSIPKDAKVRFAYGYGWYAAPKDYREYVLIYYTLDKQVYSYVCNRQIMDRYPYPWKCEGYKVNIELELRNIDKTPDDSPFKRPIMKALVMLEDLTEQWKAGMVDGEEVQKPIALDEGEELSSHGIAKPGVN